MFSVYAFSVTFNTFCRSIKLQLQLLVTTTMTMMMMMMTICSLVMSVTIIIRPTTSVTIHDGMVPHWCYNLYDVQVEVIVRLPVQCLKCREFGGWTPSFLLKSYPGGGIDSGMCLNVEVKLVSFLCRTLLTAKRPHVSWSFEGLRLDLWVPSQKSGAKPKPPND